MGEGEKKDLQPEDAEMMERLQQQLEKLTVSDHLLYMLQSLSGLAVGRMGLTPETVERRDLDQARLAIDAFKALVDLVERARPAEEMATHRGMLAQLQFAYVGALEGSALPKTPEEEHEEEPKREPEEEPNRTKTDGFPRT